jgi:hypothetical protein
MVAGFLLAGYIMFTFKPSTLWNSQVWWQSIAVWLFFPGIVQQGSATYVAATGQTQQPFLGRWSLLTASMFILSALLYAIRLVVAHQRTRVRSAGTPSPRHNCAPTNHETSAAGRTLSE